MARIVIEVMDVVKKQVDAEAEEKGMKIKEYILRKLGVYATEVQERSK